MRKLIIIIFLLGGCSANKNQIENDFLKLYSLTTCLWKNFKLNLRIMLIIVLIQI